MSGSSPRRHTQLDAIRALPVVAGPVISPPDGRLSSNPMMLTCERTNHPRAVSGPPIRAATASRPVPVASDPPSGAFGSSFRLSRVGAVAIATSVAGAEGEGFASSLATLEVLFA